MKPQDFATLEHALRDDPRGVVARILDQPRRVCSGGSLGPWEETFLENHITTLGFPDLVSWLAHRPRHPARVVNAIVELSPGANAMAAWHLVQHARNIGHDGWVLLTARLRPPLDLPEWDDALRVGGATSAARPCSSERSDATPFGWLADHGVPRGELVTLALEGIVTPDASEATLSQVIQWLGEQLVTRSAWEVHGEAILYRLLTRWGWDSLGRFIQLLDHAIRRSAALAAEIGRSTDLAREFYSMEAPPPWTMALHEALARVVIRVAREALGHGETARAKAALAALAHLHPPCRVVGLVHSLRETPGLGDEVRELVDLNVRFLRRDNGSAASLEGVLNALRELS